MESTATSANVYQSPTNSSKFDKKLMFLFSFYLSLSIFNVYRSPTNWSTLKKKKIPFFLAMLSLMNDDNCLSDWWRHLSGTNKQLFSVVLPILCVWHFMPLKSHVCLVKFSVKMLPFRGVEFSCQPCLLVQILIDTFCRGKRRTWLRWSYICLL